MIDAPKDSALGAVQNHRNVSKAIEKRIQDQAMELLVSVTESHSLIQNIFRIK